MSLEAGVEVTSVYEPISSELSPNVDDGLTSLSWLQNLNMCMTRLGAPTPPTPPASPIWSFSLSSSSSLSKAISPSYPSDITSSHHHHPSHLINISSDKLIRERYRSNHFLSNSSSHHSSANRNNYLIEDTIDYKTNGAIKPPYSYATLICMAMKANKNKMTLSSIYKWIRENFLYYRKADPSWQVS